MAIKRELSEDAYGKVLQDLSDMVKAKLPKSQYPAMQLSISRLQHLYCGATGIPMRGLSMGKLPAGGRWEMIPLRETPKSLYQLMSGNAGWPKEREFYGHGASIVVRGRESRLQERRKREHEVAQGEGRQVLTIPARGGARDA